MYYSKHKVKKRQERKMRLRRIKRENDRQIERKRERENKIMGDTSKHS